MTVFVVIGHANYYNAGNAYGGIYIMDQMSDAGIQDTAFHGLAEQIKQLISKLSGYSFGIYLYAEPLNYLFVVLAEKYLGLGVFGSECGACFLDITNY